MSVSLPHSEILLLFLLSMKKRENERKTEEGREGVRKERERERERKLRNEQLSSADYFSSFVRGSNIFK
jgi:hypothetical protein